MTLSHATLVLAIALLLVPAAGQVPANGPSQPPRVGLTLSGGAAKGLAHIGVLKVLEEVGIRPDYITGTSMGSIVGGLYAAGYSASQLEEIVRQTDWDLVLSDRISLREVILEEKPFFANQLLDVPIKKGFQFSIPEAIVQGQKLDLLLERLCMPVYQVEDFDRLPIPFRCVASDLRNARKVVLRSGNLATALRASMAIPTLFTPVKIDSMVLVDGGVVNNFPVDEVLEMGADLVIGVNVGDAETSEEDLNSSIDLLFLTGMMMSNQQFERQKELCQVFIQPKFGELGMTDFDRGEEFIALGEAAARQYIDTLRAIAKKINGTIPPPTPDSLQQTESLEIGMIEVEGNDFFSGPEILGNLMIQSGDRITLDELDDRIDRIFGSNFFDKVTYKRLPMDGEDLLRVKIKEKSPNFLKLSLLFDNYYKAGVRFGFTFRNALWRRSRFQVNGQVSDNFRFGLQWQQYLNRSQNLFSSLRAAIQQERLDLVWNRVNFGNAVQLNVPVELMLTDRLGRNGAISIGGRFEHRRFSLGAGDLQIFRRLRMNNLIGQARLEINTLDRHYLPRKGLHFKLQAQVIQNLSGRISEADSSLAEVLDSLFTTEVYPRFHASAHFFAPLGKNFQLALNPFAAYAGIGQNSVVDYFYLGGNVGLTEYALPLAGFQVNRVVALAAGGLQLELRYFLRNDLALHLRGSGAFTALASRNQDDWPIPDLFLSGISLGGGYNSVLGPVSLEVNLPLALARPLQRELTFFLFFGYRF